MRGLYRSDQRIGQLQGGQEVRSGVVYSESCCTESVFDKTLDVASRLHQAWPWCDALAGQP